LCKKIGYNLKEMISCYGQCLKSALLPILVCILIANVLDTNKNLLQAVVAIVMIILSVAISSFACLKKDERQKIVVLIRSRINH